MLMEFVKASKSAAIRLNVPYIDRFKSFSEQQEAVNLGLKAAKELFKIALLIQKDYPWHIDETSQ